MVVLCKIDGIFVIVIVLLIQDIIEEMHRIEPAIWNQRWFKLLLLKYYVKEITICHGFSIKVANKERKSDTGTKITSVNRKLVSCFPLVNVPTQLHVYFVMDFKPNLSGIRPLPEGGSLKVCTRCRRLWSSQGRRFQHIWVFSSSWRGLQSRHD